MNRKAAYLAAVLIACSPALQAQTFRSWGVKGGLSLSNQSFLYTPIDYQVETGIILGPSLALFAENFSGDHFSLQTDVAFACRGSSTTVSSVTVNHLEEDRIVANQGDKSVSRHRYLAISPMFRARTGGEGLVPYALFGPRMDVLLYYSSDSEHPLEDQNKLILGLSLGAGLGYASGEKEWFLEVLFQSDLQPVTNYGPLLINNNSLVLTFGLRWLRTP
jgi:hypothetical protein